jgi:Guanylate-binding protein, N-terminal domain/Guanylate-binding protein, C-terminal domain
MASPAAPSPAAALPLPASEQPHPLFHRPHQLFKPGLNHQKLEVVKETADLLRTLSLAYPELESAAENAPKKAPESAPNTPICVVSVVGTQRGGKSTLLNLLWGRQPGGKTDVGSQEAGKGAVIGFGLGHSYEAHTTGVWCWARPHPRKPNTVLLLCDTEGLDSPHVPPSYNWTLSALALLMSTLFVYQTHSQIDAAAVDRLGVILQVANQLQKKSAQSGSDSATPTATGSSESSLSGSTDIEQLAKPAMLWLIRDHQLVVTSENPREEMIQKLDSRSINSLRRCFRAYDCFLLPRPVHDDSLLRTVEQMAWDDLVPEFREDFVVLERQILTQLASAPLALGPTGEVVTGASLASMCELYVTAVNSGQLSDLAQLPTHRQMVLQIAGEKALRIALETYRSDMHKRVNAHTQTTTAAAALSREALFEAHRAARSVAVGAFAEGMYVESSLAAAMVGSADDAVGRLDGIDDDTDEYYRRLCASLVDFAPSTTETADGRLLVTRELSGGLLAEFWRANFDTSLRLASEEIRKRWEPIMEVTEAPLLQSNTTKSHLFDDSDIF